MLKQSIFGGLGAGQVFYDEILPYSLTISFAIIWVLSQGRKVSRGCSVRFLDMAHA